jgi:hypothetical protein
MHAAMATTHSSRLFSGALDLSDASVFGAFNKGEKCSLQHMSTKLLINDMSRSMTLQQINE